jgi:glycerol kinase
LFAETAASRGKIAGVLFMADAHGVCGRHATRDGDKPMQYVLALDQGTTSSRAILFDAEGRRVAVAQREFTQYFPQPGWVEHDPEEIWQTQLGCAREVLAQSRIAIDALVAIGIANQRETTLLWERATGRPLARAIVWQDRRTADRCAQLAAAGHEALFRARTGLVLDPYFSGTKLAWLLDNIPGARDRAERGELAFGTVDSWLAWRLTDGRRHVTDVTNASRTHLFDIRRGQWDDDLLGLLDIPRALLPEVVPSCGVIGRTDHGLFGAAIPLAGIAGDQQAATVGQACFMPGQAKNTYGTGCFMLMNTGSTGIAAASANSRSREAFSWPAPSSSGYATVSASSPARRMSRHWPAVFPTATAWSWCRPLPASAPRGGIRRRAARCSA